MKTVLFILTVSLSINLHACSPDKESVLPQSSVQQPDGDNEADKPAPPNNPPITSNRIKIVTDSASFTATLVNSPTATTFKAMLPMTINMSELNGHEKYYNLPNSLPTSASNPGTIRNGDIMLYGSNCLVLFYKTFSSSYSYTRIGNVDNPSGFLATLGSDNVTVKFEIITNE